MLTNFEAALKAETKRCVRGFVQYSSETRANHAASHRLGYRQKQAIGMTFWTHPDRPGVCFPTRKQAALAALKQ
jgi:hypothetical protein